jgi:hypothetical protein
MSAHAKLGPSAAKRWLTCPGSTRLLAAIPDPGSEPAAMGTYCHDQLARLLTERPHALPGARVVVEGFEFEYTEEMYGWVQQAARWVKQYMDLHPAARLMVEQHSPVGEVFGHPDLLWGTADIVIVNDEEHELVVADAKFGFEEVDSEENPQVSLYAMGMAHQLGWEHFDAFEQVILQPRSPQPVKVELLTRDELLDRVRSYREPVERAVRWGTGELVPSDEGCRWCRAAGRCPAVNIEALLAAGNEFSEPGLLPLDALLEVLDSAERIKLHLRKAAEYVEQQLRLGQKMPGWKLVKSNKHRQWNVDAPTVMGAVAALGEDPEDVLTEPELLSPAQVEKKLKLKLPDELASKPEGEPTLVRESDPRDGLAPEFTPTYHDEAADK